MKSTIFTPIFSFRLLLVVFGFLFQLVFPVKEVKAQALGGIPDPAFNLKDSGVNSYQELDGFYTNYVFEGPGRQTYFVHYVRNPYYSMYPYTSTISIYDTFQTSGTNIGYGSWRYFKKGNSMYNIFPGLYGNRIVHFSVRKNNQVTGSNLLPAGTGYRKDWKMGLEIVGANLFFVYPEGDSVSATPKKIMISKMDSLLVGLVKTDSIRDFDFQQLRTDGSLLYLFGDHVIANQRTFSIKVLDQNLVLQTNLFSALPTELSFEDLHFVKRLSGGQWLLGGGYKWNGTSKQGILRINANGSIDATFPGIQFPANSSFKVGEEGQNLAIGYFNGNEEEARLAVAMYTLNGTLLSSRITENMTGKGVLQVLLYHTERKQFLTTTEALIYERFKRGQHYGGGYMDSIQESRFPFWVGLDGKIQTITKHNGLMLYNPLIISPMYESISTVNPFIKKMVINGTYSMYQGKYYPRIFVINDKGDLDTTFKGLHYFPKKYRQEYGIAGFQYKFMPLEDNSLLAFSSYYPYTPYASDTVRKWNYDGSENLAFQKYRAYGKLIPTKDSCFFSLIASDNGVPIPPDRGNTSTTVLEVVKINRRGEKIGTLASYTCPGTGMSGNAYSQHTAHTVDNQNNLWVSSVGPKALLTRISKNGTVRHFQSDSLIQIGNLISATVSSQGDITLVGSVQVFLDTNNYYNGLYDLVRFDSNFVLKEKVKFRLPDDFGSRENGQFYEVSKLPDGKYLYYANWTTGSGTPDAEYFSYLLRYTRDGKIDQSFMPIRISYFYDMFFDVIGDRLMVGVARQPQSRNYAGSSKKIGLHSFMLNSSPGDLGFAQGRIERLPSPATGCNPVGDRKSVTSRVVRNVGTNQIALTDNNGFYSMPLPAGQHQLNQVILRDALERQICPPLANPNIPVSISGPGDVVLNNQFLNQTYNCSRLTLSVLQPRFRLCSRSRFTINYQNDGMGNEPDARIRISIPELVKIESASRPFTIQTDSSYVFSLGNLAPGQKGTIIVSDTIGCVAIPDSASRACFSVRLEPLSICSEVNPATINWNGAWLDAKAQYQPSVDKVRFVIYNRGAIMTDSTSLTLSSITQILRRKLKLQAGDSLVFQLSPSENPGYRLQLQQPANCPIGSYGNLAHTGRNTAVFYLAFADGWFSQQTATACPAFRFSYDPNEKIVEPVDPVDPGTELNYTIHFENYGNDTAYAVIIADTLPTGLDITSFRMTGSSHECEPRLDGTTDNPVVFFNFLPIKLPGKKQDSILSKGQVDFKIRLKDNVALGSVHQNKAHIYFDRNEPIITNTTITKVRNPDEPTEVQGRMKEEKRMMLFPNPARQLLSVALPSGYENTEIQIADIQGRICLKRRVSRTGTIDVSALQGGVYLVMVNGLKTERLIVIH